MRPPSSASLTNPDAAAVLNEAMTSVSAVDATAVVQAYDFSSIATLVDVGGGHGLMLATVLKAHPILPTATPKSVIEARRS